MLARGGLVGFSLAPANAHELSVAEGLLEGAKGWVLGDRNYWSPNLTRWRGEQGLDLLAPYKKSKKGEKKPWPLISMRSPPSLNTGAMYAGTHAAVSRSGNAKAAGMTPTTV